MSSFINLNIFLILSNWFLLLTTAHYGYESESNRVTARLFKHTGCQGKVVDVRLDTSNKHHCANVDARGVSCIRLSNPSKNRNRCVKVFLHDNCRGDSCTFPSTGADLLSCEKRNGLSFNDNVKSIRILPHCGFQTRFESRRRKGWWTHRNNHKTFWHHNHYNNMIHDENYENPQWIWE